MAWKGIGVAIVIILACLIAVGLATNVLIDWLWFLAVGYRDVFWTIFGAKAGLFLAVFAATALFLWLNGDLAYRLAER